MRFRSSVQRRSPATSKIAAARRGSWAPYGLSHSVCGGARGTAAAVGFCSGHAQSSFWLRPPRRGTANGSSLGVPSFVQFSSAIPGLAVEGAAQHVPQGRCFCAVTVLGGDVVVMGSGTPEASGALPNTKVYERYNRRLRWWEAVRSRPCLLRFPAAIAVRV